jgi:hypothetical protein
VAVLDATTSLSLTVMQVKSVVIMGTFHNILKLKVVECAQKNQKRETERKFHITEKFIMG